MAIQGSTSSSPIDGYKYDVFLSFRGDDTRNNFTNHLHAALKHTIFNTFLDDEKVKTGEDLSTELEDAIKASRASIIVLSENYAGSSWCLSELALIVEQRNQIVIPIFYHVDPSDVRKQKERSSFGDAMSKHKQAMEAEADPIKRVKLAQKIDRWTEALEKVAGLRGEVVDNSRLETEFIDAIVKDVCFRLHVQINSAPPPLIGMDKSITFVTTWLEDDSSDTGDILTILGIGGIGKTALAKYVYRSHFHEFETSSYIKNISTICAADKQNGLRDLQKQLYGEITKRSPNQVYGGSSYTSQIEEAVNRKKVFIVLDDVDSLEQLDALLGSKGFYRGSKIIITTKNAWLTKNCELFKKHVKPKHVEHKLKGLRETESLKLLCNHAFMCDYPREGYEDVSEKLVKYCQGHPKALESLGKSLHTRDLAYWKECIEEPEKTIDSDTLNVLRKDINSLPSDNDKELFKHIACFFVGIDKDFTETILKACEIRTISGIINLTERCLLTIGRNNELMMHPLLQEVGRLLVREESPQKPWKRSRLWHPESFRVLKHKKGKGNLVGLSLCMQKYSSYKLETDALSNMYNLMLLQLNHAQMNGSYDNFPEELRWLCMHGFPLKSIPLDLPMENLVALDLSYSNIESFDICNSNPKKEKFSESCSKDKRLLGSLKILQLSSCKKLRRLGGFDELPALERLILTNCICLVEVCESIEQCIKLFLIDLSYCNKLETRTIGILKKVKTVLLDGCNLGESRIEIRAMDFCGNAQVPRLTTLV